MDLPFILFMCYYTNMKKCVLVLLFFTFIFGFVFTNNINVYAQDEKAVQVINECLLYSDPTINEEDNLGVLHFGEVLTVNGDIVDGVNSSFKFYNVSTQDDKTGYVIVNFVMSIEDKALSKTLDPNAKTLNEANIFVTNSDENKMILDGTEVKLEKYEEIKIIDGYDKSKQFHEVMFEIDGTIYTGYIKTSDLLVEGFNATLIAVIFIFIIVGAIVLSIYLTTKKKRRKQAKLLKNN